MSKITHLRRAVQILRDHHEDEIEDECSSRSGQWTWNLKNWTIQFYREDDYRSVVAYEAENDLTNWSNYITLEAERMEWRTLV